MFFDRAGEFPSWDRYSFMKQESFHKTTKTFHKHPKCFLPNKVRNFKLIESFYKPPKCFCKHKESFCKLTEIFWIRKECFLIGEYSFQILDEIILNGSEMFLPWIESFFPKRERRVYSGSVSKKPP
jgi:hypothetical protein